MARNAPDAFLERQAEGFQNVASKSHLSEAARPRHSKNGA